MVKKWSTSNWYCKRFIIKSRSYEKIPWRKRKEISIEDLVKLTEDLVLAIVANKEAVKVNASEVDEQTIQIDVLVDEKDMPILIGRKGKVVNSIRTLLHASSYLHSKKNIKLNVNSL